jgi:hypothetical protein
MFETAWRRAKHGGGDRHGNEAADSKLLSHGLEAARRQTPPGERAMRRLHRSRGSSGERRNRKVRCALEAQREKLFPGCLTDPPFSCGRARWHRGDPPARGMLMITEKRIILITAPVELG